MSVPAPTAPPAVTEPGHARRATPRRWGPKQLVTVLITLILVAGEVSHHVLGGYDRLLVALGSCLAVEIVLSWLVRGSLPQLQSAYISGISLSLLVKPQGDLLWPFALGGALSIASKYVLRYRGNHLWNPTNLGVSLLLLLAAPKVAILSHEWGNALGTNAVIWAVGLLIATRARILHVTLAYAVAFVVFAGVRHLLTGAPLGAEVGPITGPMYQLFVFFMITDPRTTVSTRDGRILVAVLVAAVELVLRLANDFDFPFAAPFAPAPAIFALFLVGPMAKLLDLRRLARAR